MSFPPSIANSQWPALELAFLAQYRYSVASGHRKGQGPIPDPARILSGSFTTALVVHSTAKVMFTFIKCLSVDIPF